MDTSSSSPKSRLVLHDYSGHPFQVQLSRALAARGHEVIHQYCASYVSGRGALERTDEDPPTFSVQPIPLRRSFNRYNFGKRILQEVEYASKAYDEIARSNPHQVIFSNVPLIAHAILAVRLKRRGIPQIFWHQDIYSSAIVEEARRRLGTLGRPVGKLADSLERYIALTSSKIICISEVFLKAYRRWGLDLTKVTIQPNWADLAAIKPQPKENPWSRNHELAASRVLLYAGTLGLKHDPSILVRMARVGELEGFLVVVVTEGAGREYLERAKEAEGLPALRLLNFQPYEDLPSMLGSADAAIVLLDPGASQYSMPSKALTYFAAGVPVFAVMPADNPISRIVQDEGAGVVIDPAAGGDIEDALVRFMDSKSILVKMAVAARRYAEATFMIDQITTSVEKILADA